MQTIDERCNELSAKALQLAGAVCRIRSTMPESAAFAHMGIVRAVANTIIAERTRELAAQDGAK